MHTEAQFASSCAEMQSRLGSKVRAPPENKALVPGMIMNQLANVAIAKSKSKAGSSEEEAVEIFRIWRNLVSSLANRHCIRLLEHLAAARGAFSNIIAPNQDSGQKVRQQAVVWLAQDVYSAYSNGVQTLDDQLHLVRIWRDLLLHFDDHEGVRKIEALLVQALGKDAVRILGKSDGNVGKRFSISV